MIVISARQAEGQKIRLLDAGADDYLVKPFGIGELLARMRVALRHRGTTAQPAVTRYRHGGLDVDLAAHRVLRDGARGAPDAHRVQAARPAGAQAGQVVTHRQLLADVWGAEYVEHTHYLRLYMGQLRAKLEADPAEPALLLTEPGVGYRLAEPRRRDADARRRLCVPDAPARTLAASTLQAPRMTARIHRPVRPPSPAPTAASRRQGWPR